jgi:hypothetical protein
LTLNLHFNRMICCGQIDILVIGIRIFFLVSYLGSKHRRPCTVANSPYTHHRSPNSPLLRCAPCGRLLQDGRKIGYAPQFYWRNGRLELPADEEQKVNETPHHDNFRTFTSSAAAGCHICVLLLSQLTSDEQRQMLPYEHESYARLYHYWQGEKENQPQYEIWVAYFMPPQIYANRANSKMWMRLQLWPTQG